MLASIRLIGCLAAVLGAASAMAGDPSWRLDLPAEWAGHGAVQVGVADLAAALEKTGHSLEADTEEGPAIRGILDGLHGEEGFAWTMDGESIRVTAGSARAMGYALCRMAWMTGAARAFPVADHADSPELPYRLFAWPDPIPVTYEGPSGDPDDIERIVARFGEALADMIRHGFNHVMIYRELEHYVPWDDPHYGPRAERYHAYLEPMIALAHEHGVKVLLGGDEAVFLPSALEAYGAEPSVKDPRFWAFLQDKYRRLFDAAPELDGVVTRIGEIQPRLDFRHIDVVYGEEEPPDPRIEERYQTFILRLHETVAGELDKLFVHRTWAVGDWGMHSVPEKFARAFTGDVPKDNLLVSIKSTKQDQWYYGTAFNPTFGLSDHTTIVEGELRSQYHGVGRLVDFPARWFGAAMQYARHNGTQGLFARQVSLDMMLPSGIVYLWARLGWDTQADVEAVAAEWAANMFGPGAAEEVTAVLLDMAGAIDRGYYLRPFLTLGWNTIPLIRTNVFIAAGNPHFDAGRGHDRFLMDHYFQCKPYFEATYDDTQAGYDLAASLYQRFTTVKGQIDPPEAAEELDAQFQHTLAALALIRDYYRAFLSYGAYRDHGGGASRSRLAADIAALEESAAAYEAEFTYYNLAGARQLMDLARRFLDDPESAAQALEEAPSPRELRQYFDETRAEHERRLAEAGGRAQKVLSWRGTVDFRLFVRFQGETTSHEIVRGMGVGAPITEFERSIPRDEGGEWLLKAVDVPEAAHIYETPSEANDYTLTIFVDNAPPGSAYFEFELYWVPDA